MKIKQINKQIIDWITVKRHHCIYKKIEENTFVTNGYIGYLLQPDELLVDTDKMESAPLDDRIFKNEIDDRTIVETGDAFYHEKELYDKYKFQDSRYDREVLLNSKFLRNFQNFELKAEPKTSYSAVYVYEEGRWVGITMPLWIR